MLVVSIFTDEQAASAFAQTKAGAQTFGPEDAVELHEHRDVTKPAASVQIYGKHDGPYWVAVWS